MAKNIRDFGLEEAKPFAIIRSEYFQTRLNPDGALSGKTGIARARNVSDTPRILAYAPIRFDHGAYGRTGIFGGVTLEVQLNRSNRLISMGILAAGIAHEIRLIAATNVDPKAAIREKKLREDLYYRLNVFPIHLPPLRQRPEDVTALADLFLSHYAEKFHRGFASISEGARATLAAYSWPGNVRELKNVFERICIVHDARVLTSSHLPQELESPDPVCADMPIPEHLYDLEMAIERVTTMLIKKAMNKSEGNTAKAARLLGIPRGTLRYKIERFCP
jgi:hypothetical protein